MQKRPTLRMTTKYPIARRLLRSQRLLTFLAALSATPLLLSQAQPYNWRNVVTGGGGGYVPGIIFNPTQQNLIYARTDIGGAYRWNPSTNAWIPLMDFVSAAGWNDLGVESIATDPVDPNRLYVAVGTYTNSFTTANGAILRSTDQGNTFQRVALPFKNGGNMPGRSMGERLAIDPNLNSTIYFGARSGNGLWKSTDFGATWNKVTGFTAQATYVQTPGDIYAGDTDGVVWEVFDPTTGTPGKGSQTIYAAIADKGNSIFRSTDGGVSWSAVPGQPTGFLPQRGVLAPTGMLYITYSDGAGPFDGTSGDVWKFNTATGAWTKISPVPSTDTANDYFGYGGLAVDAQHPNTIMVAALNSWWPDTIFFRSLDGGTTWTRIWDWTSYPNRSLRYSQDISAAPWLNFGVTNPIPPVPAPKLGWMVSALQIDPFNSDHLLYGTGATIYGTNDLTKWDTGAPFHISVAAAGLEEMAVLDLVSPPSGAPLFSVAGDVTGFRHDDITKAPAAMFTAPNNGTCTSIDYAELNPKFLVRVGTPSSSTTPATFSTGFTFDGGSTWFQGNADPAGVATGGVIAAAADASRVVWSDPGAGVHFSTDNGNSWPASAGIPTGAFVASDRVNPAKFYGFAAGVFYISTNGAVSFTASGVAGLPASAKLKAVPGHEGDIWLAGGTSGLWHSTDSGQTFVTVASAAQADVVGFGMPAPGKTYPALFISGAVNGVAGLFRSDDSGLSWARINDDQHQYGITSQCITGDPRVYGRVYVCTNGRGIVVGDIAGSAAADFSLTASPTSLSLAQGTSASTTINIAPIGGFAGSVALAISGVPTGVTATLSPPASGASRTLTLAASTTATAGSAIVTVTGTSGSLIHTTTVAVTVNPAQTADFSIGASPAAVSVPQGGTGSATITITPSGGFTGSVALAATGLPAGVTATFSPATTTGTSTVKFAAASTAVASTAMVTITGTSGTLSHTTTVALTVSPAQTADFSIAVTPAAVTVSQGGTGSTTITVNPSGGFTGSVALAASGLPAGVTVTFAPTTTTGTSTATFTVAPTAATGTANVTITGTSGALTHTVVVTFTISALTTGTGGVTITPVINANGSFFDDEGLKMANTASLTALSITITVQNTGGIAFTGQYNTVGGSITQGHSSTAGAVTYTFTLAAGQTLAPGTGWLFDCQMSGGGAPHPTSGDTFTATYTTGGQPFTQTGHF